MSDNIEEGSFDDILQEEELDETIDLAEPDNGLQTKEEKLPTSPQFLDVSEPDPSRFDNSTAILADGMNIETIMGSFSELNKEIEWPLRVVLELHGDYNFEAIHDYADQEEFELLTVTDDIDTGYVPVEVDGHYTIPLKGSTGSEYQSSSVSGFTSRMDGIRNEIVVNDLSRFFETLYQESQGNVDISNNLVSVARNYVANLVESNTDFQELLSLEYDKEVSSADDLEGIGSDILQDVSVFLRGQTPEEMSLSDADMLGKKVTESELVSYSSLFEEGEVPYNLAIMYSMDLNEAAGDIDHHISTVSRKFAEINGYTIAMASNNLPENYVNSTSDTIRL